MGDKLARFPLPIGSTPEFRRFVSTRLDEVEPLRITNHELIDLEGRHVNPEGFEFVVPAEFATLPGKSQANGTSWNLDHFRSDWRGYKLGSAVLPILFFTWELMQHVGQSLNMHQSVFDSDVEQSIQVGVGPYTRCENPVQGSLDNAPYLTDVSLHFTELRPVRRLVGRQSPSHRIDTKGKEPIKLRAKAPFAQNPFG